MQESGLAGRDGLPSTATLMYSKSTKFVDDNIKVYAENENKKCCRQMLYCSFLFSDSASPVIGLCCDICCS